MYRAACRQHRYTFRELKDLLAKASPLRSGDILGGVAATSAEENVAAKMALAELPLKQFLNETVIPYEDDDVTRLIIDSHNAEAFSRVSHMTVGEFRDWLMSDAATSDTLARISTGITPEMAAAVSKLMRNQDLILASRKVEVVTRFRNTIGCKGQMSVRLQPNHPTDDRHGIAASIVDGLVLGCGDAVIGVNPASDSFATTLDLLAMLDEIITRFEIPTQSCVLGHVTTTLEAISGGAPVDLVFQSIGGTEALNESFGVTLAILA
jgi:ethanolamine ammonia-lyase large subunit